LVLRYKHRHKISVSLELRTGAICADFLATKSGVKAKAARTIQYPVILESEQ
jgi:hypothetical protein